MSTFRTMIFGKEPRTINRIVVGFDCLMILHLYCMRLWIEKDILFTRIPGFQYIDIFASLFLCQTLAKDKRMFLRQNLEMRFCKYFLLVQLCPNLS